MSAETTVLAVFLRRAQWLLDDLAFHAGADNLNTDDVDRTTAALEELVQLLKQKRPPTILDESPT